VQREIDEKIKKNLKRIYFEQKLAALCPASCLRWMCESCNTVIPSEEMIAKENGFLVGSYHYFRTSSPVKDQFNNFIKKSIQETIKIKKSFKELLLKSKKENQNLFINDLYLLLI
jgi:hypothetical protein